jgi:hypothetical protein
VNALVRDLNGTPWRWITLSEKFDVRCLVDAIDYPWLIENNWNISYGSRTKWQYYAKRNVGRDRATVRMHRVIMMRAEPLPEAEAAKLVVDHINGVTLDNRRANLRWCTPEENRRNVRDRSQIMSVEFIAARLVGKLAPDLPRLEEIPF